MENLKLCDSDYRFMLVVWEAAPVNSGELVRLCQEQLGWKKSTTYTQIKKMCEKGYIENTQAVVRVFAKNIYKVYTAGVLNKGKYIISEVSKKDGELFNALGVDLLRN